MSLSHSLLAVGALLFAGCQPLSRGLLEDVDLRPPTLLSTTATSDTAVTLTFNECVELEVGSLVVEPELQLVVISPGDTVHLSGARHQPGASYRLSATARDAAGNTT